MCEYFVGECQEINNYNCHDKEITYKKQQHRCYINLLTPMMSTLTDIPPYTKDLFLNLQTQNTSHFNIPA